MRSVVMTVVASLGVAAVAAAAEPQVTTAPSSPSAAPASAAADTSPNPAAAPSSAGNNPQPGVSTPAQPNAQPSPDDQKLLEEINRTLGTPKSGDKAAGGKSDGTDTAGPATSSSSGTLSPSATSRTSGLFPNIYNPAMSVNGLFLGSYASQRHPPPNVANTGLSIQELELQFVANVDPYFTANLIFTVPGESGFGLEEGYITPSFKPAGFEARIGKIKVPFGRENPTHTHALPFVDRSLVGQALFGDGLGEPGVEVSYLTPLPWYAVLTAAAYNGNNDVLFGSPDSYEKLGYGGLRNVFDLNDDTTLEAGASPSAGTRRCAASTSGCPATTAATRGAARRCSPSPPRSSRSCALR